MPLFTFWASWRISIHAPHAGSDYAGGTLEL